MRRRGFFNLGQANGDRHRVYTFALLALLTLSLELFSAQVTRYYSDFESGISSGWTHHENDGSDAFYSSETTDPQAGSQSLKVIVNTLGANPWSVQSFASSLDLVSGHDYTLTFWAKSISGNGELKVVFQNTQYSGKLFTTDSSWTQYTWNFTAKENSPVLKLQYQDLDTYFVDEIKITGESSGTATAITISPAQEHQTMVGFGGALTWYATRIYNGNAQKTAELYDLMFNDLGLDVLRLKNWYHPDDYPNDTSTASIPNWHRTNLTRTADYFNMAKSMNPEIQVLLSSWAPAIYLKSNGELRNGGTLSSNASGFMYNELGQYFSDCLDNIGWDPDYLSFQNEPGFTATWESCRFDGTETATRAGYSEAIDAIWNAIKDRPDLPKILGPESENTTHFGNQASQLKTKSFLEAYCYHLYNMQGPSSIDSGSSINLLNSIRDDYSDKTNWMTEFSTDQHDWIETARVVHNALTEANTSAYIYWKLVWDPSSDAMLNLDASGNYTIGPHYYTMKHYAKYVDKGYRRVEVAGSTSDIKVTGFLSGNSQSLTLVAINKTLTSADLNLTPDSFSINSLIGFQSTSGSYFQDMGSLNSADNITLPGSSITTLVMDIETENTSPVAVNQSSSGDKNQAQAITLGATDQEGDDLSYRIITPPTNGNLTGSDNNRIYTPNNGFVGSDSFTFKANDGNSDSNEATINITVTPGPIVQIDNADFEAGHDSGWSHLSNNGSVATYSAETSSPKQGAISLKVFIEALGPNTWDITSRGPNLSLDTSKEYTLSFWAKSAVNGTTIASVLQNNTFSSKTHELTTSWTKYTWNLTPAEASLTLKFQYRQTGMVWIDDIQMSSGKLTHIAIHPNTRHQEMVGFGGCIGWYQNRMYVDPVKAAEVEELLFDDLGVDSIRLKNWYYPVDYPNSKAPVGMEQQNLYEQNIKLYQAAKTYNSNILVGLNSGSPPANLKSNGSNRTGGTLSSNASGYVYHDFAQYWVDCLDTIGWNPDYISLQNEPGYESNNLTCILRPTETANHAGYAESADAIWNAIKNRSHVPMMTGPEIENIKDLSWSDWNGGATVNNFEAMVTPLASRSFIGAYSYHLYNISTPSKIDDADILNTMNTIRDSFSDRPNWMLELGQESFTWFEMARVIHNTVVEAGASLYLIHRLICNEKADTPVAFSTDGSYVIQPHYYMLKHFSKFVSTGHERIEVTSNNSNVQVSGYIAPDNSSITLVVINKEAEDTQLDTDISTYSAISLVGYQSVTGNYYQSLGNLTMDDSLNLPASSLTTLVYELSPSNQAPSAQNLTVSTNQNTDLVIQLQGTDSDGDSLSYSIVSSPSHGNLIGSGANITYTPNTDYAGEDLFTYKVNDGSVDSPTATVSITVFSTDEPLISVSSTDARAFEEDGDIGSFTITLSEPAASDLDVNYTISGTAQPGDDYNALAGNIFIPNGALSVNIIVEPIFSYAVEGDETLKLTLTPQTGYVLSGSANALLTIHDYASSTGNSYYVSTSGNDSNTGRSVGDAFRTIQKGVDMVQPGDTVYVLDGTYFNPGYTTDHGNGTTHLDNPDAVVIRTSGLPGQYITLRNYPDGNGIKPKIMYDGTGGIKIANDLSHIIIDGFEIEGPGKSITYDQALANRWIKNNYFKGKGIYTWGPVNHIYILNNNSHHNCGSGIRVNKGDYIVMENNIVSNNCWWSSSAESGLVLAESTDIDTRNEVKMLYSKNTLYNNWNRLPFCWSGKQGTGEYGDGFNYHGGRIVDGMGLYVTRNRDTYFYGRMRMENNIAFNNGINGLVYHKTGRGELVNNTLYMNGAWPGESNFSGITMNGASDVKVHNNILRARQSSHIAFKNNGDNANIVVSHNAIPVGSTEYSNPNGVTADPLFINAPDISAITPDNYGPNAIDDAIKAIAIDLHLQDTSPLIDAGTETLAPTGDKDGKVRGLGSGTDIGPYEVSVPGNSTPVAYNGSASAPFETAISILLTGSDPDGDPLTYSIVSQPANGLVSGTGSNRTYTPDSGYSGTDSFTFIVNDGSSDSDIATIIINIDEPPQNPYHGTPWEIPGTIHAYEYDLGGEGIAYHDTTVGNASNSGYRMGQDVDATSAVIGWTAAGEWVEYTISVATAGNYDFSLLTATPNDGKSFHIEVDGVDVTGSLSVPNTGGYSMANGEYAIATNIPLAQGVQVLRIVLETGGHNVKELVISGSQSYSLIYSPGTGGTLAGNTNQIVNHGGNGTEVTAVANTGYSFTQWSDGNTNASRTELGISANQSYTANFTPNNYTLSFDTDGGSVVSPITQAFASTVTAPADPTKTGFTFTGWNPSVPATMPSSNQTLTAQWTANSYMLTVADGSGSGNYAMGNVISISATVSSNVTFTEWMGDTDHVDDMSSANTTITMPASDVSLSANLVLKTYTVTFDEGSDGVRTGGGNLVQSVEHGADAVEPVITANANNTFIGWDGSFTSVTSNLMLTAQYTVLPTYALNVNSGDGDGNYFAGEVVSISATVPTGYSFSAWTGATVADENASSTTITMPSANVDLTANFTINSYTISFDSNGGSAVSSITQNYATAVTAPADPTRTGYTFAGWDAAVPSTMPADNQTLTAQWAINSYTITFDSNGGSAVPSITQNYATAVTAPTDPTQTGFTFAGWTPSLPATMPSNNQTLTAQWTANSYVLTVDDGSGSGSYSMGNVVGIMATVASNVTFTGWMGDTDHVDDISSTNTTVTMPASDVSLSANLAVKTYTVNFDEGSDGVRTGGGDLVQSVEHGTGAMEPVITANANITFIGWDGTFTSVTSNLMLTAQYTVLPIYALNVNGGDGDGNYFAGEVVSISATVPTGYSFSVWTGATVGNENASSTNITMPSAHVDLTANFTINSYTISFDSNGGSAVSSITQDYATAVTAPTDPTQTGFTFAGWDTAVPSTMSAYDQTLTAQWVLNTYTVTFIEGSHGTRTEGGSLIQTVAHGSAATPPEMKADADHTFIGWDFAFDNVTSDLTVTAQYDVISRSLSIVEGEELQVIMSEDGAPTAFSLSLYAHDENEATTLNWNLDKTSVLGDLQMVASGNQVDFSYESMSLNWNGTENFEVTVSNNLGLSDNIAVMLIVEPVNDAPILMTSSVSIVEDTETGLDLQINDIEGDSVSISVLTTSSLGTFTKDPSNLIFTPFMNTHGTENLTIELDDGRDKTQASLQLTVTPVNDAPSGAGSSMSMLEKETVSLQVAGFNFSDVDGDAMHHLTVLSLPSKGKIKKGNAVLKLGDVLTGSDFDASGVTYTAAKGTYTAEWIVSLSDGVADSSSVSLVFNVSDQTGPSLLSAKDDGLPLTSRATMTFTLDEAVVEGVSPSSIKNPGNYTVSGENNNSVSVLKVEGEGAGPYTVTFADALKDGNVSLTVSSAVRDLSGNPLESFTLSHEVKGLQLATIPQLRVGAIQPILTRQGVTVESVQTSDGTKVSVEDLSLKGLELGTVSVTLSEANGSVLTMELNVQLPESISLDHEIPDYASSPVFKLVSFPYDIYTFGELRSVLENTLGDMSNTNWLVYTYTGSATTPYVIPSDDHKIDPSSSYWMAAVGQRQLNLVANGPRGDSPVVRRLQSGWNLVGNPYGQTVDLDHFFVMDGDEFIPMTSGNQSIVAPVAWTLNSSYNGYNQVNSLSKGQGAWFYNDSTKEQTLYIDPTAPLLKTSRSKSSLADLQPPSLPHEKGIVASGGDGGTVVEELPEITESYEIMTPSAIQGGTGAGGGGGCLLR